MDKEQLKLEIAVVHQLMGCKEELPEKVRFWIHTVMLKVDEQLAASC